MFTSYSRSSRVPPPPSYTSPPVYRSGAPTPVFVAPQPQPRPRPRRPQRRFRWYLFAVPGFIIVFSWFIAGVQPSLRWTDVMRLLHVHDRERFTEYVILGLLVTTAVAILRIMRGRPKDPDQ